MRNADCVAETSCVDTSAQEEQLAKKKYKKNGRILAMIVIVGSLIVLQFIWGNYEVYLAKSQSYAYDCCRFYDKNVPSYELSAWKKINTNRQGKAVSVAGEVINFEHDYTYADIYGSYERHVYVSDDEALSITYVTIDGEDVLSSFYPRRKDYYLVDSPVTTEAELLACSNVVLSRFELPLKEYQLSIITHGINNEHLDGFFLAGDKVFPKEYEVRYTRYIDGIPSDDTISVRVDTNGRLVSFFLTPPYDEFEEFYDVNVNEFKLDYKIKRTIKKIDGVDGFRLLSYTYDKTFVVYKKDLFILSYVKVELENEKEPTHIHPFYLIIPIAERK